MDNACSSENMDVVKNVGCDTCFTSNVGVGDNLEYVFKVDRLQDGSSACVYPESIMTQSAGCTKPRCIIIKSAGSMQRHVLYGH